jgi:hypothetical protein
LGALGFVSAESDIFSLIYFIEVVLLEFPSPPRKGFVFEIPINQTKPKLKLLSAVFVFCLSGFLNRNNNGIINYKSI